MRRPSIPLILAIPVIITGCATPDLSTPDGAYRAFHQAVVDEDWDQVVTFFQQKHIEDFRRVGRQLGKAVGQEGDPMYFFLRGVQGQAAVPLRAVEVVSRGDQTATLRITAGPCKKDGKPEQCSVSEVTLRRIDNGWLLEPEMPVMFSGGEG